jgi:hypothetical protein
MSWSRRKQAMAAKLHEIERARKRGAEARLADARADLAEAGRVRERAEASLGEAEQGWSHHLSSGNFDIALRQAFAAELLDRQSELELRRDRETKAGAALDEARLGWQKIAASVRLGEGVVRKGRRDLARHSEHVRDLELAERTTWKWFGR